MRAVIKIDTPADDAAWVALIGRLNGGVPSELLSTLFRDLRRAGAISVVSETSYIDRDFSAAYSAFYSTLFRPYRKYCERLHFFGRDLSPALIAATAEGLQATVRAGVAEYLGSIVLRPLSHAPISSALLASDRLAGGAGQEVTVKSTYTTHVLGVELSVDASPHTQQDTRTGACAQATMWMAGRHFFNRHSAPWFAMPQITETALTPLDSGITRALPAGSEWLTQDNMVRALRAMGRHPVMYVPDGVVGGNPAWQQIDPKSVISKYVDSGVPVILGLRNAGTDIGHAVLAVGLERDPAGTAAALGSGATTADLLSHIW